MQIFDIRDGMRLAIRIGLVATVVFYLPSLPIEAYFQAPAIGESWEDVMTSGKPQKAIYWGIVQSVLGIILDLYMFVLPLPVITQLHISRTKRIQLWVVFSTALMLVPFLTSRDMSTLLTRETPGALSPTFSLWSIELLNSSTWTTPLGISMHCYSAREFSVAIIFKSSFTTHSDANRVVELNIAIIVCSVPGVSKFFRTYAATWTPIQSLRSKFSSPGNTSNASGSYPRRNHGWPPARKAAPNSRTDVEAGTNQTTLVSSHNGEVNRTHDYIELKDRWQVDPYLDTAGPEYAFMHTENHDNVVTGGRSPCEDVSGFQTVRRA